MRKKFPLFGFSIFLFCLAVLSSESKVYGHFHEEEEYEDEWVRDWQERQDNAKYRDKYAPKWSQSSSEQGGWPSPALEKLEFKFDREFSTGNIKTAYYPKGVVKYFSDKPSLYAAAFNNNQLICSKLNAEQFLCLSDFNNYGSSQHGAFLLKPEDESILYALGNKYDRPCMSDKISVRHIILGEKDNKWSKTAQRAGLGISNKWTKGTKLPSQESMNLIQSHFNEAYSCTGQQISRQELYPEIITQPIYNRFAHPWDSGSGAIVNIYDLRVRN